jgi:hypothetical protein
VGCMGNLLERRGDRSVEMGQEVGSLQPPAQAGSSLADFSTLKMEAIRSSKTSVHKIYTAPHRRRRHSSVTTMKSSNLTLVLLLELKCGHQTWSTGDLQVSNSRWWLISGQTTI